MTRKRLSNIRYLSVALVLICLALTAAVAHSQTVLPLPASVVNATGTVATVAVQADGKTIIGGYLSAINGVARNNIARLNIDGSVDMTWDPNASDSVSAVVVSGNTIYVAGYFSVIGGKSRISIAALDSRTGLVKDWNPDARGEVRALAVVGNTVYVGGDFETIGGQPRSQIAALDAKTALATAWDPGADGQVNTLVVSGGAVYAAGFFTHIGGQPRSGLAALDMTTGLASAWNPAPNATVQALAVSGTTVYVGGSFDHIGGQARARLAALDAASGLASPWNPGVDNGVSNPGADSTVYALLISDNTIFVGGGFSFIGGQSRFGIAALDITTGAVSGWNPEVTPRVHGSVDALALSHGTVYAGGSFAGAAAKASGGFA